MSLLEELRADQTSGKGCSVCLFLKSRPEPEQEEWAEAMKARLPTDPTKWLYSIPLLHRHLKKRGFTLTESPVKTHRAHVAG